MLPRDGRGRLGGLVGLLARGVRRVDLGDAVEEAGHVEDGFEEEVERLQELWKTDRKHLTSGVSDALLDALAITGTPSHCRERFGELRAMGIELPTVQPPADAPVDVVLDTLQALAPLPG